MKKSTVAVLLSLFVFPGAGHLYLKRRLRALAFLAPAAVAALYVINQAVVAANRIVDQILAGTASMDPATMAAQIEQSGGNTLAANLASAVMLICWLGSALDAWRLAREL